MRLQNQEKMLLRAEPIWELDAFEPLISAETMTIHTTQLHQKYVNNLNKWASKYPQILSLAPSDVLSNLSYYLNEDDKDFYINNMGGNLAHTLFWYCLSPRPKIGTMDIHKTKLGQMYHLNGEALIGAIHNAANERIGSGWVWGALDSSGHLKIYSTLNHATPYMRKQIPLFCVDFWEHAYFLDTHSDKNLWISNALNFMDFSKVDTLLTHLQKNNNLLDSFVLNGAYPSK